MPRMLKGDKFWALGPHKRGSLKGKVLLGINYQLEEEPTLQDLIDFLGERSIPLSQVPVGESFMVTANIPEKYPPISPGTLVQTTRENASMSDSWTEEGKAMRRWGVRGTVLAHHDSHGLCYDVQHEDGTVACYDPSELKIVKR